MASNRNKIELFTLVIFLFTPVEIVNGQVPECCSEVTGKCRRDCEEISLMNMALNPEERKFKMRNLHASCGETWTFFWNCMNRTLQRIDKGERWYGRSCCHLPKTQVCQMQCLEANSTEFLSSSCKSFKDENEEFFKCIERQKYADTCCNHATTTACKNICKTAFSNPLPLSMEIKSSILDKCNDDVRECIKKISDLTVSFSISKDPRCCEGGHTAQCRASCRQILSPTVHRKEIVDMLLNNGCDKSKANKRLWQCIYMKEEKTEENMKQNNSLLGLDRPKLQCCSRAVSTKCQKLCTDMSSSDPLAVDKFEQQCVGQIVENDLLQCLADVDEPCELGCEQLTHCTNFNDRPTELFRTCNTHADKTANTVYSIWQRGIIPVGDTSFHLKDISQCNPEEWKALACTLNLKPCQKLDEIATKVCRLDCEKYLMPCIDKNFLSKGETPSVFCDKFAASNLEQCISLTPYLTPSKYQNHLIEVTTPCVPNPCYEDEVCIVIHTCLFGRGCLPYSCVPGCRMGQRSNLVVARGTYVQLPMTPDVYNIVCYKVCYCNFKGELVDCIKAPCGNNDNCWNGGKKIAHNTRIQKGCNICFCYAGTLTCTQEKCHSSGRDLEKALPCNCPDHYVPVCGSNGKTYPSACVARCDSLTDDRFEFGACFDSDPCSPNSCSPQQSFQENLSGKRLLDFSSGPLINEMATQSLYFEEIVASDYSGLNGQEMEKWLTTWTRRPRWKLTPF
ncbi:reversion-inducing cysteine-rich protein with Kazal motifs-like [Centruroides sculpturatus]|uniref:reversion-inducing cysteine-rich protein with Kazal motifs-like n=2 Tax=Centruroides sculpturatus TaxID=218467 RepID=UPI000C6CAE40|nr:reversion-inducing cysteine-rich protein with Kazal motifs-like [Centruroides sculpturatus]